MHESPMQLKPSLTKKKFRHDIPKGLSKEVPGFAILVVYVVLWFCLFISLSVVFSCNNGRSQYTRNVIVGSER